MAGTNDFLPFAVGGSANVEAQADYAAETALLANGFQAGVAESAKFNKALRQSSIIAAAVAQFIANSGPNVVDDGTTSSIVANLTAAINSMITAGGIKQPVRAATAANIASLAGGAPNTLDGISLAANDRVLVKDQSTASQNGIYVVTTLGTGANGTWTRATDSDGVGELYAGMLVVVQEGAANADGIFELSTDGAIIIGTTSLAFSRKDSASGLKFTSGTGYSANTTLTSASYGQFFYVSGSPTITLPVAAVGDTGKIICLYPYSGNVTIATQSGQTLYAQGTSTTTSMVFGAGEPLMFINYSGIGWMLLSGNSGVGVGQTWQNVSGGRAIGTTYYNTTGKPIVAHVSGTQTAGSGAAAINFTINGVTLPGCMTYGNTDIFGANAIIPPGASYAANVAVLGGGTYSTIIWNELR